MGRFDLTLFLIFAITLAKAAEAKNVKEVAIEVDGEERKVEWDYTYEDVDAVARTYVRQNSLITQSDETGEEAASAISEALRSQISLEQQPVALAPVLRLASLERPGPSRLQRAETVISFLLSLVCGNDGIRIISPKAVGESSMYNLIDKVVSGFAATMEGQGAIWAKYVKVQQLEVLGDYEAALSLLEECIEGVKDEKECVDLRERKGRILKLMGDVAGACEVLDKAREVDLADRYINNKTTKYLLRAGRVEQAEKTIGLFTRHEANAVNNLFEMQCSWFPALPPVQCGGEGVRG
jgi:tetratricopeptide (TPR) repeat protein